MGRKKKPAIETGGQMPKPPRGCWFDEEAAQRAVDFIKCLTHTKGRWAGHPFNLFPWEEYHTRQIFGWKRKNGKRLYRFVYMEIPKKNGKSEWLAAILLYMTFADGEAGPEVYSAAADKDQAKIVFEPSAKMFDKQPDLQEYGYRVPSTYRIVNLSAGGYYRALSSDVKSKHGFNVSAAGIDELHAHPNRQLFDVLTQGSGDAREQPLFIVITTAGTDRNSVCFELHEKARQILNGTIKDPTFYAVLYGLSDEEEQENPEAWKDEAVWRRCNPSLGEIIDIETVREHFQKALENPANENNFRQLRLNQWVKSSIKAIPLRHWDDCAGKVNEKQLTGMTSYAGLDLARTLDLTALALVFPVGEEYHVIMRFWIPEDTMREKEQHDKVPYTSWAKKGLVIPTPGATTDYRWIIAELNKLRQIYDIKELAYDRWGSALLINDLQDEGFVTEEKEAGPGHPLIVPFGQGFKSMSPATESLVNIVHEKEKRLQHGGNPVLRWNIDNLVLTKDPAGNMKPDKAKAAQRIDGAVALIMALDRAIRHEGNFHSAYEEEGLTIV